MAAIVKTLTDLGGKAKAQEDTLLIGGGGLQGGCTDGLNDHRIAMMAAIAASASRQEVLIRQAEAVKKSYPGFFDDLQKLGAVMERKDR